MKRNAFQFRNQLIFALVVCAIAVPFIPSYSEASHATSPQDPNATLPSPKKTPTPKTTTPPPKKRTPRNSRISPAKSTSDSATAAEMIFWNSIKDSTNPDDFKVYLKKYPNGEFAELANNRLKILEPAKSSTNPTSASPNPNNPGPTTTGTTNPTSTSPSATNMPRTRTNQTGIEFGLIPAGSFMMGSTNGSSDEKPVHQVTISQPFYIGRYEVTQAQWQSAMGNTPSSFKGDNLPVEPVSWLDAQQFLQKLNQMNDGYTYRLPTEAEWEYACRAGTTTEFAFGDSLSSDQANFDGNHPYGGAVKGVYRQKTTPVGSFQPNAFGLFDMHGNVWEWCEDWYHPTYGGAPTDGSAWLSGGEQKYRVLRGGSWFSNASALRSAIRRNDSPGIRLDNYGFRVVAVARTQ